MIVLGKSANSRTSNTASQNQGKKKAIDSCAAITLVGRIRVGSRMFVVSIAILSAVVAIVRMQTRMLEMKSGLRRDWRVEKKNSMIAIGT